MTNPKKTNQVQAFYVDKNISLRKKNWKHYIDILETSWRCSLNSNKILTFQPNFKLKLFRHIQQFSIFNIVGCTKIKPSLKEGDTIEYGNTKIDFNLILHISDKFCLLGRSRKIALIIAPSFHCGENTRSLFYHKWSKLGIFEFISTIKDSNEVGKITNYKIGHYKIETILTITLHWTMKGQFSFYFLDQSAKAPNL